MRAKAGCEEFKSPSGSDKRGFSNASFHQDEGSIDELKIEPRNRNCSSLSMNSSYRSVVPFDETDSSPLERSCRWHSFPSVTIRNVVERVFSSERMPGKPRRSSSHRQKMPCKRLDRAARSASQNTNSCKQIQSVRSADSALLCLSKWKECVDDYKIDTSAALTKYAWEPTKEINFDSLTTMRQSQPRGGCIQVCTCIAVSDGKLKDLRTRSTDGKLSDLENLSAAEAELRGPGLVYLKE